MAMERCTGVMEVFIKANGAEEYNMDKERFMYLAKATKKEYSRTIL